MGRKWRNPITVQGVESDDNRLFNQFVFRDLPLAMRWDREDDGGHRGAVSIGVMTRAWQEVGASEWWGEGEYADIQDASDASALAEMGAQFFSVDPGGKLEYHWEIVDPQGEVVDPVDVEMAYDKIYYGADDKEDLKTWLGTLRERTVFDLYEVGAVTQVDIPCWPQCRIALVPLEGGQQAGGNGAPDAAVGPLTRDPRDKTDAATRTARVLLRRLAAGPATRKAAFYDKAVYTAYTKLTITDDGQIRGHLAAWNACHRGLSGGCVRPTYQTTFDDFHQGETRLDNGERLRTGVIGFHQGHLKTVEQYDRLMEDPAAQLGTCRLYADEWGIQACGQVHPDCDPQEVARALAGAPSGDWRLTDGKWLLHGLAYVNTPGYAHYESSDGHETRMIASIPAPLEVREGLTAMPVDRAFFDAPAGVLAQACACEAKPSMADGQASTEGEPEPEPHAHAEGDCGCGGTCGSCGTQATAPTPADVLALAQLDAAVAAMGPRVGA